MEGINFCPRCGSADVYTASYRGFAPMVCKVKCRDCKYEVEGKDMAEAISKWNGEGTTAAELSEETRKVLVDLVNVYQAYAYEGLGKAIDIDDNENLNKFIQHSAASATFLRAMYYIIDELLKEKE